MKSRNQLLLENKIRKMVREELMKEEYYRLSKFKKDINDLIDKALAGGNDSTEVISVLQQILTHRFNQ